jgi:hypothetical protein
MLKPIASVFCLLLLLVFQYGRMINYWGCELISLTNTAQTCDCEKQSKDTSGDTQQPSSQRPAKDASAEFFAMNAHPCSGDLFCSKMNTPGRHYQLNLSYGITNKVFQPPRA